jgi:hypothetical protein
MVCAVLSFYRWQDCNWRSGDAKLPRLNLATISSRLCRLLGIDLSSICRKALGRSALQGEAAGCYLGNTSRSTARV